MEMIAKQFTESCTSTHSRPNTWANAALTAVTAPKTNHSGRSRLSRAGRRIVQSDIIRQRRQNEERGGGSDDRLQCRFLGDLDRE